MEEKIIQAVDIGTTKVAAIVAKVTENNKLEILGIGTSPSFGVIRADVANISRTVDAIKKAVSQAEAQSGIPFTKVYVGIAGSHINSLQHRAMLMRQDYNEIISQKDIDQLIEDTYKLPLPPGDMIIELLPPNYKIDNNPIINDPIGMLGNKIEANIHVITGSSIAVNNIKRCIREAGMDVEEVIMQPIASAAAVLSKEEMEQGVALVDIGGGTTDLAIFVDGVIGYTAVIPFGGEVVTEDIRQGCKILKDVAENIKITQGSTFPSENDKNIIITIPGLKGRPSKEISMEMFVEIIKARMEEILESVIHEINLSGLADDLGCGIVFTGGGSQLKYLRQLAEYMSGYDVKIGVPNEHLSKTQVQNVDNPIYSTAVGLVIKGMQNLSHEHSFNKKVENTVDNPPNVENNIGEKIKDIVDSPPKPPRNGDDEESSGIKGAGEPKGVKISSIIKKAGAKISRWIGDDQYEDFQDIKK